MLEIGITHLIAHTIIFLAYIVGALRVPPAFKALIRMNVWTIISGAGFFLFCGLTHLGLALDQSDKLFFVITDHLQAVSIVSFLLLLQADLNRALTRLRAAFKVIQEQAGKEGERAIATVVAALQGSGK